VSIAYVHIKFYKHRFHSLSVLTVTLVATTDVPVVVVQRVLRDREGPTMEKLQVPSSMNIRRP
jgi:hypothetical protein